MGRISPVKDNSPTNHPMSFGIESCLDAARYESAIGTSKCDPSFFIFAGDKETITL